MKNRKIELQNLRDEGEKVTNELEMTTNKETILKARFNNGAKALFIFVLLF
jgi:hypothetical protein